MRIQKTVFLLLVLAISLFSQGLQYEPPVIEGFQSPYQSRYSSLLTEPDARLLKLNTKLFSDTARIDFESRQITFMRNDSLGVSVWNYHYGELNDYIMAGRRHSFIDNWYKSLTADSKKAINTRPAQKLQWELAVHYPPWAKRLLGNEPPRLRIEGKLEITIGFENGETRVGNSVTSTGSGGLVFDNNYEFGIHGSVGRLININITANRNDGFDLAEDPLKNFKIEYKETQPGELEDEIIQEVSVGYTGFDMPGTSLSGYSEKKEGLFGIKVRSKLGPLMLTTIASHSQGEAITKDLGGASDRDFVKTEKDFVQNRYFFLDTVYRTYYNTRYNLSKPNSNAPLPPRVQELQVFRSVDPFQVKDRTLYKAKIEGADYSFEKLTQDGHYYLESNQGWIRFADSVRINDADIIAITMRSTDGKLVKGVKVPDNATDTPQSLWVLKKKNSSQLSSSDSTFSLMWRNVFDIYGMSEQDFSVELVYVDPAKTDDTIKHVEGKKLISDVIGLTENGKANTKNSDIFAFNKSEIILPPFSSDPQGNEPFANPELKDLSDSTVYRYGSTHKNFSDYKSKFILRLSGTSKPTSFDDLGWNIMEGTVTLKTSSGKTLQENVDYTLDYQMGYLELISPEAKSAQSLTITYQRESDFVLEKKVFAGARGEIRLPFISDNSFAAMSLLYQNAASSSKDIPQLGSEPFNKLHLSFNTSLDFQPEWMTSAVNLLPLVKTEESSSAKFDLEVVHSRMNPNTTRDGAAYLDDFERTDESYGAGITIYPTQWFPSHFPFPDDSLVNRPPAWDNYWFRPLANDETWKVNRFSVWKRDPNNTRVTSSDNTIEILRFHVTPAPQDPAISQRFLHSYGSITQPFYREEDLETARYLELVIRPDGAGPGKKGKLTIQIGKFSEDQVLNGGILNENADFEDSLKQNDRTKFDLLDRGLDFRWDDDEFYLIPKEDKSGWDTLSKTQNSQWLKDLSDPSGDNYKVYDKDHLKNYRYANRTQRNDIYDSEDINKDGSIHSSVQEQFYSFTIDLDDANSPYINHDARVVDSLGWRLYRIPLKEDAGGIRKSINSPDWKKIGGVRLVYHDFAPENITREHRLLIERMNIVGSSWETVGLKGDSTLVPKIEASSISNQTDSAYLYSSLAEKFVTAENGEATPEEKSLRLRFFNLEPGDTALVAKNMNQFAQNISGYDSLSFHIHGDSKAPYNNELKFVFRFGTDSATFYEYRGFIKSGWNKIKLSLQDLADLKPKTESDNLPLDTVSPDRRIRIVAPANKRPNFSSISYMAVGVMRDNNGSPGVFEGELWVNELKVTGSRDLNGWAARTTLNTQWADFLSFSTGMSYTEGSFRTMTDKTIGSADKTDLAANINVNTKLDKFFPDSWGLEIPLGGSVSGSVSRPIMKPNSDIRLLDNEGKADNILDLGADAANMMLGRDPNKDTSEAERFQTFTTSRNAFTSFKKTTNSSNPLINFTVDRISTDLSYNMTATQIGKGRNEDPDSADYIRLDTTESYTGVLKYDLSPRDPPSWTSFTPFSKPKWVPKLYKNYKFNFLPSVINFDLAEVVSKTVRQEDTKLNVHDYFSRSFDLRHGMRLEYSPINPLINMTYNLKIERDMSSNNFWGDSSSAYDSLFSLSNDQKWREFWILNGEKRRTQNASLRFSPQFFSWLTHSADYSADYTGSLVTWGADSADYVHANIRTSLRFKNSLYINDLFSELAKTPLIGNFFGWMRKGVDKVSMRSVGFDYDVTTDLSNNYLSSSYLVDTMGMGQYEFLKYQLGMGRSLDDYLVGRIDPHGFGGMQIRRDKNVFYELYQNDQATGSWNARFSTNFSIPYPLKIDITSVSVGWGREFRGQPDSTYIDTTVVFPDIRVSANSSAFDKLPFIKKNTSRFNVTSSMNFKEGRKEFKDRSESSWTLDFAPLIGIEGTVKKWPITFSYRHNNSKAINVSNSKGENSGLISTDTTVRTTNSFTLGYEIPANSRFREIKLFNWVIPVQGKTRMGLNINSDNTKRISQLGENDPAEDPPNSSLTYSPFVTYKFTDNVDSEFKYTGSHTSNNGKEDKEQNFSIIITVVF